jgi:hypothetical protein
MMTLAFLIYAVPLVLATVIALVFSIRYYRSHRSLRIFTYYIFFSLLADIAAFWERASGRIGYSEHIALNIYYNLFIVIEFLAFSLFILHYVRKRSARLAIKTTIIVFLGIFFLISFVHFDFVPRLKYIIYIIAESVFLVFPCLIYYYELFITVTPRPLKDEPSFWAVTGIFVLKSCSIPLWLTLTWLGRFAPIAFSLNSVLYSILFILLIRAYCCSPDKRVAI